MKEHPIFAAIYDRFGRFAERHGMAEKRQDLLSHAAGTVLEIGAGTGLNFAHYPKTVTKVIATEPDPYMLRRAREAAARAPVAVEVHQAPAETLPVPDGSVDAVVSTLVLCSVQDPAVALAEARRVLRPGGVLLFLEHVRANELRLARWQDRLEGPWGWFAGGCHPNRDTAAAIRAAGFEIEDAEPFAFEPSIPLIRPHASGVARRPA